MNQEQILLKHFSKHKYINSMIAFKKYGMTRLSAVIFTLRDKGYKIETVWRTGKNRYGNVVRYVDYFLIKGNKQ